MQPDKFTTKTQAAIQAAQSLAHKRSHQEIDGEHLLSALLEQEESLIPPLLQRLDVNLTQLVADLDQELAKRVQVKGTSSRDVYLSNSLKKVLDAAESEAEKLKDEYISTEHLLLGLLDEGSPALKKIFQTHKIRRDT